MQGVIEKKKKCIINILKQLLFHLVYENTQKYFSEDYFKAVMKGAVPLLLLIILMLMAPVECIITAHIRQ